ncbi:MAG: cytochrome c biogenesis protein CcsA [Deltaproteobacteria bacterium]|nr:cytochrome c biogenesis protein CcsA [Deltaproteobacteria bacterium]
MLIFSQILQTTLPVLYGAIALSYLFYFYTRIAALSRVATVALLVTAVLHLGHTVVLGIIAMRHPMATIFEFLSFVAMTMAFIFLFLETWYRNGYIGAFALPAVFVLQLCASLGIQPAVAVTPLLEEVRFALHATAFAAAYAAFLLGLLFGVMVILFERSVKRHHFGIVFEQLPSLSVLGKMTASTLLLGFVFMSIGLGLGAWNVMHAPTDLQMDAKVLLTILVWLVYGFAIFSRFVLRWSDESTAILSIAGFALLAFTTVATHVTFSSWHNFVG